MNRVCISKKQFLVFFISIVLVLGLFFAVKLNTAFLVQQKTTGARAIFGGSTAATNKYPYFVKITTSKGDVCGGVLISPLYVLTAAHCVYPVYKDSGTIVAMIGVNTYLLPFMGQNISYADQTDISIPDQYKPAKIKGLDADYDIALVRLKYIAWFVPTLSFPDSTRMPEKSNIDKSVTIIGIGSNSFGSSTSSKTLQEADIYIRSSDDKGVITLNSKDDKTRKGVCHGDSGGPAIMTLDGSYYVIGLAKSGWCVNDSKYTSTSFNAQWITNKSGVLPNTGTMTPSTVVPTQAPLTAVCSNLTVQTQCEIFTELCHWDSIQKKCVAYQ